MTSKRLFADLCAENRKRRLWPIALSVAGNFFAQIVFAFILISEYERRLNIGLSFIDDVREAFVSNTIGPSSIPVLLIVMGFSVINALQGFSYLFDSRMSDLYGSLPIKREKLFDAVCLNGAVIFVIPYLLCAVFTVILGMSKGFVVAADIPYYIFGMISVIALYLMLYLISVLASILTGHIVVAFLGTGVLQFGLGCFVTAVKIFMTTFFFSYAQNITREDVLDTWLSPIGIMTRLALCFSTMRSTGFIAETIAHVGVLALVAAIFYIIDRILISKRPSEAAGKAMAFKITKPFIKCFISVTVTMYMGILFYILMDEKLGGLIFGLICGIVFTHIVIETIYEFDFKACLSNLGTMWMSAGIVGALTATFIFDLTGYDTYLPRTDRVENCALAVDYVYPGLTGVDPENEYVSNSELVLKNMQLTDMSDVEVLTDEGASFAKKWRLNKILTSTEFWERKDIENYIPMTIRWNLNNKKSVYRTFYINPTDPKIEESFSRIFENEEYKRGLFALSRANADDFRSLSYSDLSGEHIIKLSEDDRKKLLEAVKTDIMNQKYEELKKSDASLEYELIAYADDENSDTVEIGRFNFYVFPSFTETRKFLEEKNLPTDWKEGYETKSSLRIEFYNEATTVWTTEDPEEIKQVYDNILPQNLFHVNDNVRYDENNVDYCSCYMGTKDDFNGYGIIIPDPTKMPESLQKTIKEAYPEINF